MSISPRLFGPDRIRPGYESVEWAVWVLGPDDIHEQDTLTDALAFAAEHNSMFADLWMREGGPYTPVVYAVVLHYGYAWNRTVEHQLGGDCGLDSCGPCSDMRAVSGGADQ